MGGQIAFLDVSHYLSVFQYRYWFGSLERGCVQPAILLLSTSDRFAIESSITFVTNMAQWLEVESATQFCCPILISITEL